MLNYKKYLSIFIFFFYFSTLSAIENKIAYINIDLILSNSIPSKSLFNQLKTLENIELEKLKNEEKKLKSEENEISNTKNVISNEEFLKKVDAFNNKVQIYQNKKKIIIQDLQKNRNKEVLDFLKLINPHIEEFMNSNSVDILIEKKNIFIAKSNYDITDRIIEIINKNIKEFDISK